MSRPARTERGGAVRVYAQGVHAGVLRHAREIDRRHHVVSADGPVERELAAFPPVHGLVFGARAEASPDLHQLAKIIASEQAMLTWRAIGARFQSEAYTFMIGRIRRRWGCVAAREHARMRLSILELVGSRGHLAPASAPGESELRAGLTAEFQEGLEPVVRGGGPWD